MSEYSAVEYECEHCGPFVVIKSSFIGGPDVKFCPECNARVVSRG